ncbi:hypothetical protein LWI29_002405 [Acer saccharum]|uniref:Subtilisin-like protease n=1 Tax=Acer saccharum TaxID=4024 RepID=A0AA39RUH7_ACESA|nr:hypothetical protein LWI29_002405 [Acer saccharum]
MASSASSLRLFGFIFLVLAVFHPATASSNVYIVYMGDRRTYEEPQLVQESHHELLSYILGSKEAAKDSIMYSYKHGFSGFAAVLTRPQAKLIADLPGVVHVVPNRILSLHTTRSWDFLRVKPHILNGLLSKSTHSSYGSIIGVMDTGIWPESESFRDEGMGEVPSRWRGMCQEGEGFNHSNCNRKIIGARWYIKGYEAEFGKLNTSGGVEFLSPRDAAGHAKGVSVVCSAGNSGPYPQTVINTAPWVVTVAASTIDRGFPTTVTLGNNQSFMGQAFYTRKGKLNKFHPIVYGEDIAAFNANDNSAGSCDSGTLNATLARGKVVFCFQSRSQRSATVAADTVLKVNGAGLIFAQFPTKDVQFSFGIPIVQVDFTIGTSLLTYMELNRNPVVKFCLTKTTIGQQISPEVVFFSSRGPSSLSPSVLKPDIAAPGVNVLASWSPVSYLSLADGTRNNVQHPLNFKIESGTSMSCPHISGIVALLKAIHPTWSPAAIKSALITTASLKDEYDQIIVAEGAPHKQADPFDYGGGHVDPNKATDPGLVYDMRVSDYTRFLCALGYNNSAISLMTRAPTTCRKSTKFLVNLNLPSITIPELKHTLTVSRKVTNVGPVNSVYVVRVQAPAGVTARVEPSILTFNSTTKKLKFKVIFRSKLRVQGRYSFGYLFWEDGFHVVRIPLIIRTVINDFLL